MKGKKLFFLSMITIFFITLTGCTSEQMFKDKNKDQFIMVEKRVGNKDKLEKFNKITDERQVLRIKEIINEKKWVYVSDLPEPSGYQFAFINNHPNKKAKIVWYKVCISPDRHKLELIRGNRGYAQLTGVQSTVLFEILAGGRTLKKKEGAANF